MTLLIALTLTSVAGYLKMTLTEEIEAVSAGLVACIGLCLSLYFAPLLLKLALLVHQTYRTKPTNQLQYLRSSAFICGHNPILKHSQKIQNLTPFYTSGVN